MFGHLTYLIFELVWALPIVLAQWIVGHGVLRRAWRMIVVGAGAPTLYFSAADAVAIHQHIWTLTPSRILGLHVGPLPIEEAIFFLVTNLMVVQGLLLLGSTKQWTRARALISRARSGDRGAAPRPRDGAATRAKP